ncbi:hypothetical protein FHS29_003142 [Saccharothrix tamanrassetensis]|uniref:Uncharacterized protein n=1 Tax=Saccharothrix tamanrassetensis TaxID=1051531 RepID=A0A841CLW3_9PSEU|nr:hypothetical protein [Saccharothrix tamanrassetensis]MBB5956556.1 hypothetical protein [Saccharothrix tamanrassetensis]
MTVVVRLKPLPRWWVWRPGADRGAAVRLARQRARRGRSRVLLAVAVPLACALVVLAPSWWSAVLLAGVPFLFTGAILLLPQRFSEWDVVVAAAERDVVHCEQFDDADQRRRARKLCEHFLAVREHADSARLAHVEALLWQALVALRDSLPVRDALAHADNRPGLAAAIAEQTRALADLDRRVDRFAAALRVAVEELDPELAASALRRVAALDPL